MAEKPEEALGAERRPARRSLARRREPGAELDELRRTLPVIFMALMGLSMLVYVVLDGYDLGVGMLMPAPRRPRRT